MIRATPPLNAGRPRGRPAIPAFVQARLERRDVPLRELCRALGRVECACDHRRRTEGRVEPAGPRLRSCSAFNFGLRGLRRGRRWHRPWRLLVLLSLMLPLRRRGRLGLGRRARRIRPDIRLGRHLRLRCLTDLVRRNNFDHNGILVRLCKRRRAGQCDRNPQQSMGNSRYGKRAAHEAAKPPIQNGRRQFLARISPDGMASKHHNVCRLADRATFPAGETDLPLWAKQNHGCDSSGLPSGGRTTTRLDPLRGSLMSAWESISPGGTAGILRCLTARAQ